MLFCCTYIGTTIFISRKYAINVACHRSGRHTEKEFTSVWVRINAQNGWHSAITMPINHTFLHHLDCEIRNVGNANDEEGQMGIFLLFFVAKVYT